METAVFKKTLVAVVAVLLIASHGCGRKEKEEGGKAPEAGSPAPEFTLKTLDGKVVSLGSLKGKVVVINFWASWCGPCKVEAPGLEKVYGSLKGKGVEFVGIALQDTEEAAKKFIAKYGITFPNGLDSTGEIMKAYNIMVIPKTYITDKEGRISYERTGVMDEESLAEEINKVL